MLQGAGWLASYQDDDGKKVKLRIRAWGGHVTMLTANGEYLRFDRPQFEALQRKLKHAHSAVFP